MDPARLQDAIDWATTHNSFTVLVIRHGCLIGESRLDPVTGQLPLDGWSMTKSATSMVAGRAMTLGLFNIDKPVGPLFPEADAAHAALTPRDFLTMTSGLHRNWARDLVTASADRVRDTLSLPFDHEPGTAWLYHQGAVTFLANAVERSIGMDLQDFAQQELFGPIGIQAGSWTWERDLAGHTEGWAHLHMKSADWARLGLLMLRGGNWHGRQLLSEAYITEALKPLNVNPAYGLLWWVNGGDFFVVPDVYGDDAGQGSVIPSGPDDMYMMVGLGEQRVYVIPSRDMIIVRMGQPGSQEPDTRVSMFTGRAGELDYELVRKVLLSVNDVTYDDPGPYQSVGLVLPPVDDGIAGDVQDPVDVIGGLGLPVP